MSKISKKIFLDAPEIGVPEKKFVNEALDTGYVSTVGPFVPRFEEEFAGYVRTGKAVSTQSGTAAIHMALYELGISKGDEVIVPALTFVATVNPVIYVGAKPVFADVDAGTWNIDPDDIEKKITKRTKAIIPVHLYGNPCDMAGIMRIARKHRLHVIEDATESLGATHASGYTGTHGDMGCFSFNGNKTITTGGGGMVVSRDPARIDHIKFLVNQARDESRGYYHPEVGFNYRMTNIEAALGLAQMRSLKAFVRKQKDLNGIYREELRGVDILRFQEEYNGAKSSWWMSCVLVEGKTDIEKLRMELKGKGVPTRRVFMPVVEFPPYKAAKRSNYKNSYHIYERGLCLPSSTLNSEEDIRYVARTLKDTLSRRGA